MTGEGGIGKSTLVRHVASLAMAGELDGIPENRAAVVVDFSDPASASFETILLRVRAGLGGLAKSWPAFDVALAVYWERKHPGESLTAYLNRGTSESRRVAEQVGGTVDQVLGGFGAVTAAYQVISRLGTTVAQKARLRRLRAELPALDPILEERDPDRMLGYMPVLLAADLERVRAQKDTLALCVLDTVENLQDLPPERDGLEDLVSRLVYLMPNVAFVAAGRRPPRWDDPVRAVGLTYGGEHRWPGLAGRDRLVLDGFERASALEYLTTRLTIDDRPAIEVPIRERMIEGSGGSPLYLDLSAALYGQYLAQRETPPAEAFGLGFPELVLRTMRDLSEQDRDLLRAAALLEAFDAESLHATLPQVRRRRIEDFLARPFVHRDDSVWPACHLHDNLRRSVLDCDAYTADGWTGGERHEHLRRAIDHMAGVALSVWDERPDHPVPLSVRSRRAVAAFQLVFRGAHEHGVLPPVLAELTYSLSVLGHWQVLASLPEPADSPELAKLATVARLTTRGDLNAEDRYQRMRELVIGEGGEDASGPFADYYRYELASRAHVTGRVMEAGRHLSAIGLENSHIGASALFGQADNALRRGEYVAVEELMERASGAGLDKIRVADMLGHTYIHNARFEDAAALFRRTLDEARAASAPLWEARAMRHLALALMWYAPERTLDLTPAARELNDAVGELIGVAQCDLAASMAHALQGEHDRAAELLEEAARRYEELGATAELTPAEAIRVLQYAAAGRGEEASAIAQRLAEATRHGEPECLPVWVVVTGLWAGLRHPETSAPVRWLGDLDATMRRWRRPLERLRTRHTGLPLVPCGRLDVADRDAPIPTDRFDTADIARIVRAASTSPSYDGPPVADDGTGGVVVGRRTILKPQRRRHERLETVLRFERLRAATGLPAPRLLDHGTIDTGSDPRWWAVLQRLPGTEGDRPTPAQQRELGRMLRAWHAHSPAEGMRLDEPGALGVFLGWTRTAVPDAYPVIAGLLSDACAGMPMVAIHGDVAVGHNALFDGDTLTAVLDPGAIGQGPPMLDLAWALAVDLPHGGSIEPLIEGYGDTADREGLDALLPLMLLRRLVDTPVLGIAATDGRWIARHLRNERPDLLALVEDELEL
ncbi:phosphotransferase [Actinomadura sp. NBRC 104412]|uniref:phosphotransferase n=1 Tax=Actinomadura sp. NBRC 104412 TaxID=3032203 RepID=UPI0025542C36|nr:phosphotransferase [Actinomadura sp. NBRC 104412]